jgi:uncharacterized protein (TIGR03435 family)
MRRFLALATLFSSSLFAQKGPAFEVATIKPSKPGAGMNLALNPVNGQFSPSGVSLSFLITMAYGIHAGQVIGAPSWIETAKFDIVAKPDIAGVPDDKQLRMMIQKLLADRFGLAFHHDKKELAVYVLRVGKDGPKLKKPPEGFIGMMGGPPGQLGARSATIAEFADYMQRAVLDRPVLDQTGISGKWDLSLSWRPDEFQVGRPTNGDTGPDIYTAIQQQLGLRLVSTKAPADVIVIDHIEKPSEN